MFNLDASIIPGESAGGCYIGQPIAEIVGKESEALRREPVFDYRAHPTDKVVYHSQAVDVWVTVDGTIDLIGVHGPYRGRLLNIVNLGMTIDDIERLIGPCAEDEEDTLSIQGIQGLSFDVLWHPEKPVATIDFRNPELRYSPVTWFWIYQVGT